MCMGVRNVIREFIWTALLFTQVRTGFFLVRTVHVSAGNRLLS